MFNVECKAQRIDTGEWVKGFYFKFKEKSYITYMPQTFLAVIYSQESVVDFNLRAFEVDPDTLCRATGATDKNGVMLWENDVVRSKSAMEDGLIKHGAYRSNFGSPNECHIGFYVTWTNSYFRNDLGWWTSHRDIEVIGNVIDNPELFSDVGSGSVSNKEGSD